MDLQTAASLIVQFCEDAILSGSHKDYQTVSDMALALHTVTGKNFEVVTCENKDEEGEWYYIRKLG